MDDHELVREGLAAWLSGPGSPVAVLGTAATVAALRASEAWGACVVLLDLNLRDGSTVTENVARLVSADSRVVVVSESETPEAVRRAVRVGALGYVSKSAGAEEMLEAIVEVSSGGTYMSRALALALLSGPECNRPKLSDRELGTLQLYAGGMPLKSVARRLGVTEGAVKSYVDRVREKYAKVGRGAPTKIDLYRRAVEDGHLAAD
ncbi:MAG: response regulator transcription factor [Pseudonocardia sp.]|nr:response regulator transcription factor [Pseudonocardia sp.]